MSFPNGVIIGFRQVEFLTVVDLGSTPSFLVGLTSSLEESSHDASVINSAKNKIIVCLVTNYFYCFGVMAFICKRNKTLLLFLKEGKLLLSHRYNLLPLLRSRPGGFEGSWSQETCPAQK